VNGYQYWHALTGLDPTWLHFDSKFTIYPVLDQLRQRGIHFITIGRRGTVTEHGERRDGNAISIEAVSRFDPKGSSRDLP
jgi:hypothetical protein